MKFILSGEGPTDIGDWGYRETGDRFFRTGPMTLFLDILALSKLGVSPLAANAVIFIDESELSRRGKDDPIVLRGKKAGKGSGLFTKNAQALGLIAKEDSRLSGESVVAVLFRDGDGTQSRDDWGLKKESIERGFERAEFQKGVPMVPHPKSEAWLLCALKKGYQSCKSLESRSGNDASPHSLKAELEELLGEPATRDVVNGLICAGRIDPHRIDMPSFNVFKQSLVEALL